jgi:hypothetical protein
MIIKLKSSLPASAVLAGLLLVQPALAAPLAEDLNVPLASVPSVGEIGDPANTRLSFELQPGGDISYIGWDVSLSTVGTSWLSDMAVTLTNSAGEGVTLTVADTDAPGSASFAGALWLPELDLGFSLGADGMLHIEFHEVLDDFAGADGNWNAGMLVVSSVPEPGTYGLMAMGAALLAASVRNRRRKA